VRIDDLRASMTMGQPFPGIWLPRGMLIHAGLTLAAGSYEASYARTFSEYREAEVKTTIRVPKGASHERRQDGFEEVPREREESTADTSDVRTPADEVRSDTDDGASIEADQAPAHEGAGPRALGTDPQRTETIREVRVHGNASLADADVLKLAGIAVGEPISDDGVKAIEKRLKDSDWFETVEVRKRYRSLDDPGDVAIVLVVHERPGVTSAASPGVPPIVRPWRRITSRLMFLPIISYADGYGFTYGGRVSTVDLLGAGERLSVPLTWGGTKRAAIEFERTFRHGPVTRVLSSLGIWNRENPRFGIDDQRVELKARAERQFAQMVRVGVDAARSSVSFGQLDDRLWTVGADAALDTRGDPAFPGNAVLLGGGWSELHVTGRSRINRYNADARGYLRIVRQSVLAGRVQYFNTDAALPPYERLLLGGASTLRGFRAGAFDGDRMVVTSGELRVPITSVLSGAKVGVTVFADAAKVADFGASLSNAEWRHGAGAGVFLIAPLVKINVDVAHARGGTRLHIGSGFAF
jgi:outer membrane protein assembly factor BamA